MRAALALSALLVACAQGQLADAAPIFPEGAAALPEPALRVYPADQELRAWVETVAPRIERATGLVVVASDDYAGVPLFWGSNGDADWMGFTHGSSGPGDASWLALDPSTPLELREVVVLHEVLHALGAPHVGEGEGVLSPHLWRPVPLTAADLEALCAARDCTAFNPEGGAL